MLAFRAGVMIAAQLPWVGSALNWQGQPYAQLQWEKLRPLRCHFTSAIAASKTLFSSRHNDSPRCRAPEGQIIFLLPWKADNGHH
jgi:hypothetical protein